MEDAPVAVISQETCKAIMLTGHGGYDKLQVQEVPVKQPKKEEIRVKVEACGLNFAELMMRQGLYGRAGKPPYIPGFECAGTVEVVGENVADLQVGQRVVCVPGFGAWSERVVVDAVLATPIPDEMTYEEAAAIPVNYLTAYFMLFRCAHLREGHRVLIHMAAGGVGVAATQLAKSVPNVTLFGTASASKHKIIKEIGIDHPIDYRTLDYAEEVKKIAPDGIDIVLDPLAGKDFKKGFNLLRRFGVTVLFGAANILQESKSVFNLAKQWFQTGSFSPFDLISKNRGVCGMDLGSAMKDPTARSDLLTAMKEIIRLYTKGVVKPRIDSVFSFEEVAAAQKRIHDRLNIGKIILVPRKEEAPEKKEESKEEAEDIPADEIKVDQMVGQEKTDEKPAEEEEKEEKDD